MQKYANISPRYAWLRYSLQWGRLPRDKETIVIREECPSPHEGEIEITYFEISPDQEDWESYMSDAESYSETWGTCAGGATGKEIHEYLTEPKPFVTQVIHSPPVVDNLPFDGDDIFPSRVYGIIKRHSGSLLSCHRRSRWGGSSSMRGTLGWKEGIGYAYTCVRPRVR